MGSHRFNGRLVFFFILGLILNAGGNALTVALNLGSPVWTATCVNVARTLHVSLGLIMVYWGAALIIATILITRKIQGWRTVKNVVFMVLFAALVNWLSKWFEQTPLMTLPIIVRVLLDFGGIGLIAAGVSLYQRVNWMLHPCDDLMQIVRFRFFEGNANRAMLAVYLPAVLITVLCVWDTHHLWAVNIGTIFALVFQGWLIGVADRRLFRQLRHRGFDD